MTRTNGEGSGNTFHQSLISVIIISMINRPPPPVALIDEREKKGKQRKEEEMSAVCLRGRGVGAGRDVQSK